MLTKIGGNAEMHDEMEPARDALYLRDRALTLLESVNILFRRISYPGHVSGRESEGRKNTSEGDGKDCREPEAGSSMMDVEQHEGDPRGDERAHTRLRDGSSSRSQECHRGEEDPESWSPDYEIAPEGSAARMGDGRADASPSDAAIGLAMVQPCEEIPAVPAIGVAAGGCARDSTGVGEGRRVESYSGNLIREAVVQTTDSSECADSSKKPTPGSIGSSVEINESWIEDADTGCSMDDACLNPVTGKAIREPVMGNATEGAKEETLGKQLPELLPELLPMVEDETTERDSPQVPPAPRDLDPDCSLPQAEMRQNSLEAEDKSQNGMCIGEQAVPSASDGKAYPTSAATHGSDEDDGTTK